MVASNGINGGLVAIMATRDKLGGTLQGLHNIFGYQHGERRGVSFAYFKDV